MPAFLFAVFTSAFLLFLVQPIAARHILPWFGGSPAVWTTCMLCFQAGLLAGYTYAHLSAYRCTGKHQLSQSHTLTQIYQAHTHGRKAKKSKKAELKQRFF